MIFAAGLGTRLKPLTDTMPKAIIEVGGEPLLKRVIKRLREAGTNHLVINVHHFANQIIDYLKANGNFGLDIRISDESDNLLDTGGGLKKAAPLFCEDSPILIHNVDILSNVDLREFYNRHADHAATLLVSNRKTTRYLLFDDKMHLVGWTNVETGDVRSPYPNLNPANCKRYAFSGIHLFSPHLFSHMNVFPNKFGIMDFYLTMCAKADIQGYAMDNLQLLDVGKLNSLSRAETFLKEQQNKI